MGLVQNELFVYFTYLFYFIFLIRLSLDLVIKVVWSMISLGHQSQEPSIPILKSMALFVHICIYD
uniref:Uncharacterized protein n=1 Tax=Solanum lycopersicum TaxID=4081 RepID=A0A3Q7EF41_SOLLC